MSWCACNSTGLCPCARKNDGAGTARAGARTGGREAASLQLLRSRPVGYGLHRTLLEAGVTNYVVVAKTLSDGR